MVADLETGKVLNPIRFDVHVKAAKGATLKPLQVELLTACGNALLDVVREASVHEVGDRKVQLTVDAAGSVTVQIQAIKGSADFDERGMELEQMALSAFLTGMGSTWTAGGGRNLVQIVDEGKSVSAKVDTAVELAKMINARGRATGTGADIPLALIIDAEREAKADKGRSR